MLALVLLYHLAMHPAIGDVGDFLLMPRIQLFKQDSRSVFWGGGLCLGKTSVGDDDALGRRSPPWRHLLQDAPFRISSHEDLKTP
jgi:hypothetical protein